MDNFQTLSLISKNLAIISKIVTDNSIASGGKYRETYRKRKKKNTEKFTEKEKDTEETFTEKEKDTAKCTK